MRQSEGVPPTTSHTCGYNILACRTLHKRREEFRAHRSSIMKTFVTDKAGGNATTDVTAEGIVCHGIRSKCCTTAYSTPLTRGSNDRDYITRLAPRAHKRDVMFVLCSQPDRHATVGGSTAFGTPMDRMQDAPEVRTLRTHGWIQRVHNEPLSVPPRETPHA